MSEKKLDAKLKNPIVPSTELSPDPAADIDKEHKAKTKNNNIFII
ncbi:hypothetical protein PESP_a0572 [Pseudoalteromonas espejiana DSM 9414]|nr:hypothetical protein PESP_a0572 [Pseudoalteromonas espejiana DSM 9414]